MQLGDAILAIDGGQTSTAVWLGSTLSDKAFQRQAPGFHYSTEPTSDELPTPTQLQGIQEAVGGLLAEADCAPDAVGGVCCSLSGRPPGLREYLEQTFPTAPILLVEDRVAAYAGTLWKTPGVALVGGTGTVALGYNGERWLTIGGWGYLFGDVGGGWGIAQRAIMAAIAASEKRGPDSVLPERLLQLFSMESLRELAWALYEGRLMRREYGRATPLVLALAGEGDLGAQGVIETAAEEYTGYIRSLCTQLGLASPIQVGYTGGVLTGSPFLLNLIDSQLRAHGVTVERWHSGSALAGSALLALEAAGSVITDKVIKHIHSLIA